jgi:hypothetical protein
MEKEGVVRYDPLGNKFDPNLHNALFEVPDATKEPGTVAVVIKVRPAKVVLVMVLFLSSLLLFLRPSFSGLALPCPAVGGAVAALPFAT